MPYDSDTRRTIDLTTYADEAETLDRLTTIAALSEDDPTAVFLDFEAAFSRQWLFKFIEVF